MGAFENADVGEDEGSAAPAVIVEGRPETGGAPTADVATAKSNALPTKVDKADHYEMLFLHQKFENLKMSLDAQGKIIAAKEAEMSEKYALRPGDHIDEHGTIQRQSAK